MKAAFRSPLSGVVTTGANHFEAFAISDVPSIDSITDDDLLDNEGFWDGSRFLTRAETAVLHGIATSEELDRV